MASVVDRYKAIKAAENSSRISALDRYKAIKTVENADSTITLANDYLKKGNYNTADTDSYINKVKEIEKAYDTLNDFALSTGSGMNGYEENKTNLKKMADILSYLNRRVTDQKLYQGNGSPLAVPSPASVAQSDNFKNYKSGFGMTKKATVNDVNIIDFIKEKKVENTAKAEYDKQSEGREKYYDSSNFVMRALDRMNANTNDEDYFKAQKQYYESLLGSISADLAEVKSTNKNNERYFPRNNPNNIDWNYEYVNNIGNARRDMNAAGVNGLLKENDFTYMAKLSSDEKAVYNYLHAKEGKEEADRYLEYIKTVIEERSNQQNIKGMQSVAEKTPALSSVASVGANILGAAEQVGNYAEFLGTGKMNKNFHSQAANSIRSTVMDKVDWEVKGWDAFDFIYGTGMSAADSVANMVALGPLAPTALGLSAAANTTNDVLERGGNSTQAFWSGLSAGVFESIFEKWSIGNFKALKEVSAKGFKNIVKNIAKSMGVNASEEWFTEVANIVYDTAINTDISNASAMITQYKENGLSEKEAKKKTFLDLFLQTLEAAAGGALMGIGFGTVGSVSSARAEKQQQKALEATSNAITNPVESYPKERQNIIQSFLTSVDEKVKGLVQRVKSGDKKFERLEISDVKEREATDIKNLLGIDVSGYTHNINSDSVRHIINRHGENGQHDTTMSSDYDISRIGWVLENYDTVETISKNGEQSYSSGFADKNDTPAPQIKYTKKINGTYYVVEAAFENKYKKMWVQSAYLSNNKEAVTQASAEGNNINHEANARSALASPTSNNTVPQSESIVNNNYMQASGNNSSLQSSAKEGARGFRDSSDKEIYRDLTQQESLEALNGERKNAKQRHITDVAKSLDSSLRIVWADKNSDKLNGKNGKYVREINTIYLAKDMSLPEMYVEVFKHEFVHRLESKGAYKAFKDYLINKSVAFEQYVRSQLKIINGEVFNGSREEAIKALTGHYYNTFKNDKTLGKPIRDRFTLEDARREIVADFGGEVLFKGKENRADIAQALADVDMLSIGSIESNLDALEELAKTDRNLFQKLWDVIKDFISSLKMVAQNKRLVEDLEYIEQRMARVYNSKDTKKAAKQSGGEKYQSIRLTVGDLDKYLKAGNRKNRNKLEAINSGKKIILTTKQEITDFINDSIEKKAGNTTVAYGMVNDRLAEAVYEKSKGKIIIKDNYLELIPNDLQHAYEEHSTAKQDGDIALKRSDFENIPEYLDGFTEVVYAIEYSSGNVRICISKKLPDGRILIIETVSKSRGSLQFKNAIGVSEEKYQNEYVDRYKKRAEATTRGNESSKNTLHDASDSNDIIDEIPPTVKNNISTENENYSEDGQFSVGSPMQIARENLKKYENGELTREQYLEENERLWGEAIQKYGSIEEGENAQAPIQTPKAVDKGKLTEQFIRTVIETGKLTDEMLESVEEKVLTGGFSYTAISDESSIKKADTALKNGTAEDIWENAVNEDRIIGKDKIAIGERLLAEAIEKGDTKRVLELSSELADMFTRAGQTVQAARLIKKMTGAGRLISAQRAVKNINKDLQKKYGITRPPVKISEEAAKRLANAKTEKGIENAYSEIMQEVADQMPSTFIDKFNAWRYWAMLCGSRTHIRNIVGNGIFVPMVRIKDTIACGLEGIAVVAGKLDTADRTKQLIIKKEYADFAKADGENTKVRELLKGNKYNDKNAIREKQKIFKTEALNFLTDLNSNLLEAEDMLFKNKHYIHALASFLQSRNANLNNLSEQLLDEARVYAVKEAKKATFNDENAIAEYIQQFSNKNLATNMMVEGVLPFKRTPMNIVRRGVEYSPIGLGATLTKGMYDVKKGNITVTEYIDNMAAGMTGTGVMLVGMLLANLGIVVGGMGDDDEDTFEKMMGKQEYSIEVFGKSYTIDWSAPSVIPFMIGAEIVNTMKSGEELNLADVVNVVGNFLEPITELSCLSGISSVIEATKYADSSQTLIAIVTDALTSYATQSIPSLSGATARTIDSTQRSWYTDKNSKWFSTGTQALWNNIRSKIPGLTYTQAPKIDAWGQVVSRGGVGERLAENFISPGYYSEVDYNEINNELLRLGKETGENVYPRAAAKFFTVNGETKLLTADEYVTYAKAKGKYSYDYIKEFTESKSYKKLTDTEKAEVIKDLYEYANAKAKTTVSDYDLTQKYKTVTKREKNGYSAVDYYIYQVLKK